ncbi:MFS transporter [bacterium]|nr:MFS transporter [bacterium]
MNYSLKGTPAHGLWGATLGFFIGFAAVSLFGPTANRIKNVMDLSPFLVGILVAIPALTGSLLRIPFAAWVDTTGGRKPFLVLLALSIIGMSGLMSIIMIYYPDNMTAGLYPLLLFFGALCGCGIATFSVGIGQVSYWFPQKKQGSALGTFAGIGNMAPGLFAYLLPVALTGLGLAGSYMAWLIFLIAGTFVYYGMGRNAWFFQFRLQGATAEDAKKLAQQKGQELFPKGNLIQSLSTSAKIWKTWVLVAIYFATFGGFIALTAWFPTYWSSFFKVSAVTAGLLTSVYSVLASVIRVFGGKISDKLGGERTTLLAISTMIIGAILLTLSSNFILSVAAEIILAIGMGVGNASVFKLVPQEVPQAVGGAAGWVGGLGAFGGFVIPPIMGYYVRAMGEQGYSRGFTVFIVLSVLSLGLAFILKKTHKNPSPTPK